MTRVGLDDGRVGDAETGQPLLPAEQGLDVRHGVSQVFETGVFPPVQYSADNHFGGTAVHMLEASCSDRTFHTIATFVNRF